MASVQGVQPDPQLSTVTGHPPDGSAQKRRHVDSPSPGNAVPLPNQQSDGNSDASPAFTADQNSLSVEGVPISESKRRAQNRAAQRAFRERKERHLKELEYRLAELESESRSWKSTNMALRSQLTLLEEELLHYRQPQQQAPAQHQAQQPPHHHPGHPIHQQQPAAAAPSPYAPRPNDNTLPAHMLRPYDPSQMQQQQPQQQPYMGQPLTHTQMSPSGLPQQPPQMQPPPPQQPPQLHDSHINMGGVPPQPPQQPQTQQQQPSPGSLSLPGLSFDSPTSSIPSRAEEFCDKLSVACGTRDRPVPESAPRIASDTPGWQQDSMFTPGSGSYTANWVQNEGLSPYDTISNKYKGQTPAPVQQQPGRAAAQPSPAAPAPATKSSNDPLSLDFGNIGLGFGPATSIKSNNEIADLDGLLNNDFGVFDPLDDMLVWDPQPRNSQAAPELEHNLDDSGTSNTNSHSATTNSTPSKSPSHMADGQEGLFLDTLSSGNLPKVGESTDEQVPVASQKFIPCADVWDRICSHPRFGEIDINSMCQELRNKARCSKSGVVLDEQDVDAVLGSLR